jgi:hypothetical protein
MGQAGVLPDDLQPPCQLMAGREGGILAKMENAKPGPKPESNTGAVSLSSRRPLLPRSSSPGAGAFVPLTPVGFSRSTCLQM